MENRGIWVYIKAGIPRERRKAQRRVMPHNILASWPQTLGRERLGNFTEAERFQYKSNFDPRPRNGSGIGKKVWLDGWVGGRKEREDFWPDNSEVPGGVSRVAGRLSCSPTSFSILQTWRVREAWVRRSAMVLTLLWGSGAVWLAWRQRLGCMWLLLRLRFMWHYRNL